MEARGRIWRTLVLLGILGAMTGFDSGPGRLEPGRCATPMSRPESSRTPMGGLRVVIDPQTGKRLPESRPFLHSMQKHSGVLSQSTAGLLVVSRPDGSKHLDLQGRFQCGLAVRLGPDGPQMFCVSSETEMQDASQQLQTSVVEAEEE